MKKTPGEIAAIGRITDALYGLTFEQRMGLGGSEARNILSNIEDAIVLEIRRTADEQSARINTLIAERDEARTWVRRLTAAERVLTCAFCGEAYPPGTPESNDAALTAHVSVCAKHPVRAAEAQIAKLEAARCAWEGLSEPERQYVIAWLTRKHEAAKASGEQHMTGALLALAGVAK